MPKIERLMRSVATGNFYFVKIGKSLGDGVFLESSRSERSEKVDVTKEVQQVIIRAMMNNHFGLCAFCGQPALNRWGIDIHKGIGEIDILTCERCKI